MSGIASASLRTLEMVVRPPRIRRLPSSGGEMRPDPEVEPLAGSIAAVEIEALDVQAVVIDQAAAQPP